MVVLQERERQNYISSTFTKRFHHNKQQVLIIKKESIRASTKLVVYSPQGVA